MAAIVPLPHAAADARPVLHLSGERLRAAMARLLMATERVGGIESFTAALKLKSHVFQERLGDGRSRDLALSHFDEIVPLMATVRRRIGAMIAAQGWPHMRGAIGALLDGAHVPGTADARIAAFEGVLQAGVRPRTEGNSDQAATASGRGMPAPPRFLRDLAAEILHNVYPEHYPLMTRWVWDAKANTGVLREIWHDERSGSDDVDHVVIDVPDGHDTFLVLREELSQFLSYNGIFRDMLWYVDLLFGQIYGDYINAQGGAWLKTDFGSESDPLEHTLRILGLDRVGGRRPGKVRSEWSVVNGQLSAKPSELTQGSKATDTNH